MYRIHPWLPIVVIDLLLAVPFYVVGMALVGTGRVRRRTRDGPGHVHRLVSRFR
jgi:signal peptidase